MALPAWYWPLSGASARTVSLSPFSTGIAVADWTTPTIWPFSPPASAFQAPIVLATGSLGLCSVRGDSSGGVWALAWDGRFWHVSGGRNVLASNNLPATSVYVGAAMAAASAFFLSASGSVYNTIASPIGSWPVSTVGPLVAASATLATLLQASGLVGTMNSSTGVSASIAFPSNITTAASLCGSSGAFFGIAGWTAAPNLSGAAAAAVDPQEPGTMMAVGSGYSLLWRPNPVTAVSGETWAQTQVLTGLANLNALAWRPDGVQALATSLASGVQAIGFIAGNMSLAQTLALTGACSVAIAGTSVNALVAQSGQARLTPLAFTSTWASSTAITGFPGVVAVASYGATGAVAAWASGITFLTFGTGGWAPVASASTSFAPTALTVDEFLQVYVAGSGALAVFSGTASLGSGSWSPTNPASSLAAHDGRIVVSVPASNRLYVYGESAVSTWTQQTSAAVTNAPIGLAQAQTVLFSMGSATTNVFSFSGQPFELVPVVSGNAAVWNGSAWATGSMGIGNAPSACVIDASGKLQVVTVENNWWTFTVAGTTMTGVSGIVTQYSGQTQSVPLGASSLLAASGSLYVGTSLPGVLEQVA